MIKRRSAHRLKLIFGYPMAFYLSYRSIPELAVLEQREAREIWVAAYRLGWRKGSRNWVAAIVGLVVVPGVWLLVMWLLSVPSPWNGLISVLVSTTGAVFMAHVATQSVLPYIQILLSKRSSSAGS